MSLPPVVPLVTYSLADYRAAVRRGFEEKPIPAPEVQPSQPPTPSYSRGSITMLDQGDVRIDVELGPLLKHHVFRGTSEALQMSVWA